MDNSEGIPVAGRDFRQGEVVIEHAQELIELFTISPEKANIAMRKGRLVAWRCIEAGEELFLDERVK